ncbi:hypothetical protein F1643_14635 [Azospirillum sp. INR13]|uniref:hypothetical protein n=1 Tax=Azospirillum sp. INR13 TaxID=2596919 RepID=UPI0018928744|nr:hypothetical protein [Azospirillum sp. INR13]MBF5095480.1 hypothetical protein [Azospirillum sp. INR13]
MKKARAVVPDTGSDQNRKNACKINILGWRSDGVDLHGGLLRSRHDAASNDASQRNLCRRFQ